MYRRLFFVIVALNVVALVGYGLIKHQNARQQSRQHKDIIAQVAHIEDEDHMMEKNNTIRLHQIQDDVNATGSISNQDLSWILSLINHPEDKDKAYLANVNLLVAMYGLKNPPASQQDQILKNVSSLLVMDLPNDKFGLDKSFTAHLMQILHNKQAVPYLLPLLHDPRSDVQSRAQRALSSLGYNP